MFADLLHIAPSKTPFVFHDMHTTQSVCGNDLKPDIVMCLRDKHCVPLATAAIIDLKQQGGRYDNNENVGKAFIYGKAFLQQFPAAAHDKPVINRDVRPSNLMYIQLTIYLVDWGSATLQQSAAGTIHYASLQVLQQLTCNLERVEVGPADDLESLVTSLFCISHPDAHKELQRLAKLPAAVMHWWTQT